jgi:hypothetical protein
MAETAAAAVHKTAAAAVFIKPAKTGIRTVTFDYDRITGIDVRPCCRL